MTNPENRTSPKHNNLPVTCPQDMEIYDLPSEDVKVAVLRKFKELQENTKDNSMKLGNKQKQKFNKAI